MFSMNEMCENPFKSKLNTKSALLSLKVGVETSKCGGDLVTHCFLFSYDANVAVLAESPPVLIQTRTRLSPNTWVFKMQPSPLESGLETKTAASCGIITARM